MVEQEPNFADDLDQMEENIGLISKHLMKNPLLKNIMIFVSRISENLKTRIEVQEKNGKVDETFAENKAAFQSILRQIQDTTNNQDQIKRLLQDTQDLLDDISEKEFVIRDSQMSDTFRIYDYLEKLWAEVKKKEEETKAQVSSDFLNSEAALFWINTFGGNCQQVKDEEFVKPLKEYLDKNKSTTSEMSSQNLIKEFLKNEDEFELKRENCDNFFLKWNSIRRDPTGYVVQMTERFKTKAKIRQVLQSSSPVSLTQSEAIVVSSISSLNMLKLEYYKENYDVDEEDNNRFLDNNSVIEIAREKEGLNVKYPGKVLNIKDFSVRFGRSDENTINDINFKDGHVSRKQMRIILHKDRFFVDCLAGTNLTALKLKKNQRVYLTKNLLIELGGRIRFYVKSTRLMTSQVQFEKILQKGNIILDTISKSEITEDEYKSCKEGKDDEKKKDNKETTLFEQKSKLSNRLEVTQIDRKNPTKILKTAIYTEESQKYYLGLGKTCTPVVDDSGIEEFVGSEHCVLQFDKEVKLWFLEEKEPSEYGTFVFLKNYDDWCKCFEIYNSAGDKTVKEYRPSRKQILSKGMQIYFSAHYLNVTDV